MLLSLSILAGLSFAEPVFADLGDTKAQSIERYGEVSEAEGNRLKFHSGDLEIEEWLSPVTRRVESIVYTSAEGGFEEGQIEAFEFANIPAGPGTASGNRTVITSELSLVGITNTSRKPVTALLARGPTT